MDKKKKPPPGATLISRLRANRAKRDEALAEQQKKGTPPPPPAQTTSKSSNLLRRGSPAQSKPSAKKEIAVTSGEFVSRPITIEDLRPSTYEYQALTDEIHQAGRFAAAGLIAQGLRLYRLQSEEIYKDQYGTFEDYCREEHSMSATYAYRLMRMAEMAETLANQGNKPIPSRTTEHMPDPFEVLLGLGHRHLLAILPLEPNTITELLLKGLPTQTEAGTRGKRIPINKATEQQIREAIKLLLPQAAITPKKPSKTPAVRSVHTLEDLVNIMQDWQDWLQSEPEERLLAAKIGDRTQASKLARRLHSLSEKLVESLHNLPKH